MCVCVCGGGGGGASTIKAHSAPSTVKFKISVKKSYISDEKGSTEP